MILELFRLDGQVALVTGGDKGLGQGMAVALAQAGADIAIVSRSGHADATLAAVEAAGGSVIRAGEDRPEHGVRAAVVGDVEGHVIEMVGPLSGAGGIVADPLAGGARRG